MMSPEDDKLRRQEYDIIKNNLAKRVRVLRKTMSLSQEKLALSCGLDRTFVNHIEHASRNVTLETLHKVSLGLNVTLSELLENIEFPDPEGPNGPDGIYLTGREQ